jgi:hypothetical protein
MARPPRPPAGLPLLALVLLAGTACNGGSDVADPPTGPSGPVTQGGVEYTADTRVMESFPVQLDTRVTMTNRTNAGVSVQLGSGCPINLRAYRDEARTRLAWDQSVGRVCTMQVQIVDLAPGASAERNTRATAADILGDSLPDGRYYLSAAVQVVAGGVIVPAGSADLGVPR